MLFPSAMLRVAWCPSLLDAGKGHLGMVWGFLSSLSSHGFCLYGFCPRNVFVLHLPSVPGGNALTSLCLLPLGDAAVQACDVTALCLESSLAEGQRPSAEPAPMPGLMLLTNDSVPALF